MMRGVSLTTLSTIAGLVTAVAGLLVLIGWQFDGANLKFFLPRGLAICLNIT